MDCEKIILKNQLVTTLVILVTLAGMLSGSGALNTLIFSIKTEITSNVTSIEGIGGKLQSGSVTAVQVGLLGENRRKQEFITSDRCSVGTRDPSRYDRVIL
uniref:Uncharacterized protein n=1 Tax=Rhipicephalus microplus TaxID=6941 RepID=A0A6G5A379_RHIMP